MDAVDCAQLRVLRASPGSESVAFEASGVLGLCMCVCGGMRVMSCSHGDFKCHLKCCNYKTTAHKATVAI